MSIIQPTKCRLRSFRVKGVDARLHLQCIRVYESMCKQYKTFTFTIVDNNNFINGLSLQGLDEITFSFDAGDSSNVYEDKCYILDIPKELQTPNLKTIIYEINCAGAAFFKDRANLVQRGDALISGTGIVQQIHDQYVGGDGPLQIKIPSMGLMAKQEIGSFITANKKPITAIFDILNKCVFPGYKSGSPVYFRDRNSYVISPLEHLFATMSAQSTFVQKATWGADWRDTFTATHAIIAAQTVIGSQEGSGRGGSTNLIGAAKGSLSIFDISQGTEVINKLGSMASLGNAGGVAALGNVSKFIKGKHGGIQNVLQTDERRNPLSTEQGLNMVEQNMFQAQVKDATNYLIKVPIQGGLECTVGKGVNAKLLPPTGDQATGKQNIGGLCLVADLMHECYFDKREVMGTTTMRIVKGGFNA